MHQVACTTAHLTNKDVVALCDALGVPTPTPDVPLDHCLRVAGHTPDSAYAALSGTTDVRLMIAAAALRGTTQLPPDPRLRPAPHEPCGPARRPLRSGEAVPRPAGSPVLAAARRAAAEVSAPAPRPETWGGDWVVLSVAHENPKRPGSVAHDRYARLSAGSPLPVSGSEDRVGLERDVARGLVRVGPPPVV